MMKSPDTKPKPRGISALLDGDGWAKAFFLLAAFCSFVLSVLLWFGGHREQGLFVGIWVPSICSAGALILTGRRHG